MWFEIVSSTELPVNGVRTRGMAHRVLRRTAQCVINIHSNHSICLRELK